MNKKDIKDCSFDDLQVKVSELRKQLFNLRFQMVAGQIKDYAQFKRLRADIARTLTMINHRSSKSVA